MSHSRAVGSPDQRKSSFDDSSIATPREEDGDEHTSGLMDPMPSENQNVESAKPYVVSDEEINTAFEFFSSGLMDETGEGIVTLESLKSKLGAFYENVPIREYKFLMDGKDQLTLGEFKKIVSGKMTANFDPIGEAFKVYDPDETGYVDTEILRIVDDTAGTPHPDFTLKKP